MNILSSLLINILLNIENISEEMRILYVAFTRAKEKLIITGATSNLEKSLNSINQILGYTKKEDAEN